MLQFNPSLARKHPLPLSSDEASGQAQRVLKVGVVGVGTMGRAHARIYSEMPNARLVGIVDTDDSSASSVAFAAGCRAYESLDALLDTDVEAITIATPTQTHADVAVRCLKAGKAVLIEKPIAGTLEDARAIIDAAREAGVVLMVGHVERFNPAVRVLREAIAGQRLISLTITRVGPFPPRMSEIGVVIDLAVHDIDLVRWLTGDEIEDMAAFVTSIKAQREDVALLQMRTTSGVLSQINTNWLTPFKARIIQVASENAYFIADLITRQVTEHRDYREDGSYSVRQLHVRGTEPLREELDHFVSAVLNGEQPEVTGEEGLRNLELALQCLGPSAKHQAG